MKEFMGEFKDELKKLISDYSEMKNMANKITEMKLFLPTQSQ